MTTRLINRIKMLESLQRVKNTIVENPVIISRGHITKDDDICLLCGKNLSMIYSHGKELCEGLLSDEELHKYMGENKDTYVLFIWHENYQVDPYKPITLDTDYGIEYTGFTLYPDVSNDHVTVKFFSTKDVE